MEDKVKPIPTRHEHYQTLLNQPDSPYLNRVVGVGNFDGVHRGHQSLIDAVVDEARIHQLAACILTFDPHPLRFFRGDQGPRLLYSIEDRVDLMGLKGIEMVLTQTFDEAFAALSPEQFVSEVLVKALRAKHVVVGYDFAFGARRAGRVDDLKQLGAKFGFTVDVLDAQGAEGRAFSSSWVREVLSDTLVHQAREVLGRPYHVRGEVKRGFQRGRQLGFPTANLMLSSELCPAPGVYAGWLDWGEGAFPSVISIGNNPTFQQQHKLSSVQAWSVEVHILEPTAKEDLDIYDRQVILWFSDHLRDPMRFDGVDELVEQIRTDIQQAREKTTLLTTPDWPVIGAEVDR